MPDQHNGSIFQVNVSNGGVPKLAVRQAILTPLGLVGDRQRNTQVHGGPERALCLYSLEKIQALQAEGHPIFPGAAGENLTLAGLDWEQVKPGARLQVGKGVVLEITKYTTPCDNLTEFFIDGNFNRIHPSKYSGWARLYAKVIQAGEIQVGDRVTIVSI